MVVSHAFIEAMSEALVKKALAEEDSAFLKSGGTYPHKTTAAQFVSIALDLEEAQYVSIIAPNGLSFCVLTNILGVAFS